MRRGCSAGQLIFEGFEGRQVVGAFDGGAVTSNAGRHCCARRTAPLG